MEVCLVPCQLLQLLYRFSGDRLGYVDQYGRVLPHVGTVLFSRNFSDWDIQNLNATGRDVPSICLQQYYVRTYGTVLRVLQCNEQQIGHVYIR